MSPIIKDSDSLSEPPHLEDTDGEATSSVVTPFPEDIVNTQKVSSSLSNRGNSIPKSGIPKSKSSQQLDTVILRDKRRSLGSFFGNRLSGNYGIDLEKEKGRDEPKVEAKKDEKKEQKLKRSQSLKIRGKSGFGLEEDRKTAAVEKPLTTSRKENSKSSVSLKEDKPSKLKTFATKLTRLPKLTFADVPEIKDHSSFNNLRRSQSMKITPKKNFSVTSKVLTNQNTSVSANFHTPTPSRKSSYIKLQNHSSNPSRMNDEAKSSSQKSKSMHDVRESLKMVPKDEDVNVKVNSPNFLNKSEKTTANNLNLNVTKDALQSRTFAHKTIDVIRKSVKNKLRNNLNKQYKMKTVLEVKSASSYETKNDKKLEFEDKKQVKLNSKRKKLESNESDNEAKPKKKALQRKVQQSEIKDSSSTHFQNNKTEKKKNGNVKNIKENKMKSSDENVYERKVQSDLTKKLIKKREVKHRGLISDNCGNFPLKSASAEGESAPTNSSVSSNSRLNAASDETSIHSLFLSQIDGTMNHNDIYSLPMIRKRVTCFLDSNGNEQQKIIPFQNSSFMESTFAKLSGSLPMIVARIALNEEEDEDVLRESNLLKSYSEMCLSESSVTPSLQESDMISQSPMSMSHQEERTKRDSNSPMSFTDHDAYIDDSMDELLIQGEGESYFGTLFAENRFLWDNFNDSFTEMETDFAKEFLTLPLTDAEICNKNYNALDEFPHDHIKKFPDHKFMVATNAYHSTPNKNYQSKEETKLVQLQNKNTTCDSSKASRRIVKPVADCTPCSPIHLENTKVKDPNDHLIRTVQPTLDDHMISNDVGTCYRENSNELMVNQQIPVIDHCKTDSSTSDYISLSEKDFSDCILNFAEEECSDISSITDQPRIVESFDSAIPELSEFLEESQFLKEEYLIDDCKDEFESETNCKFKLDETKSMKDEIEETSFGAGIDEDWLRCEALKAIEELHEEAMNEESGSIVNDCPLSYNNVQMTADFNDCSKIHDNYVEKTADILISADENNKLLNNWISADMNESSLKNEPHSCDEPTTAPKKDCNEVVIYKNGSTKIRKSSTESDLTNRRKFSKSNGFISVTTTEVSDQNKPRRSKPEPTIRKISQSKLSNVKETTDTHNKDANSNEKKRKLSSKTVHTEVRKELLEKENKKIITKESHEDISEKNKAAKDDSMGAGTFTEGSATSGGIGTPSSGRLSSARDHRLGSRVPPKASRLAFSSTPHEDIKGESPSTTPTPLPRRSKIDTQKTAQIKSQRTTRKLTDPVKVLRSAAPPNVQLRTSLPPSSDQLKKLEAELSARNKELHSAEEEATRASRGVEALTVLVHHLVKEYEAFSTPRLKSDIDRLCCQLTDVQLCLDESNATARRLEDEAIERSKQHAEEIQLQEEKHLLEVNTITEEHQRRTQETLEKHQLELRDAIEKEDSKHDELIKTHKCELERIESEWRAKLDKQHERHLEALQELNTSHTQQFQKAEAAWEAREKELQENNSKLLKEQSHLKQQARKLEDTLLSDKDHRLQAARSVCTALQNEVDSLKTVVEMRNCEVHKLRDQVTDRERMTDDLEAARDRVRALQAKTEDLLAQMEKKSKLERQLLADQQFLAESLQRESSANKLLSLENEELQWKLKQREQALAGSYPTATLDLVTRCSPNIPRQEDGCQSGGSSPQVTPRFQRNGSRSQSALKSELEKRWSQSYNGTYEDMGKFFRKSELRHEDFTIESPPPSPRVKGVIEKSNSVSFILDLNDTFPEDPFLGVPSSPLLRKPRTPTLSRKPLQKSFSNAALEKSSSTSFIIGRSCRDSSLQKKESRFYPHEGNFKRHVEHDRGRSAEDIPPQTPPLFPPKYNSRGHSTSDSSDGGDMERVSPTGLAWTVPVHSKQIPKRYQRSSKDIPHRFQLVPETPRLLQQPDEDEYEEIENEFVEVLTLDCEDLNSAPLTTLFAQTPSTSVSLSDSDISQCGSRGDLSTEEDSTDDEDGTQKISLPEGAATKWRPQDGAGEAMIFPDVFNFEGNQKENLKKSCDKISKSQISSAPSSDSEDPPQHPLNGESGLNGSWSEDAECDLTSSSEMQEL